MKFNLNFFVMLIINYSLLLNYASLAQTQENKKNEPPTSCAPSVLTQVITRADHGFVTLTERTCQTAREEWVESVEIETFDSLGNQQEAFDVPALLNQYKKKFITATHDQLNGLSIDPPLINPHDQYNKKINLFSGPYGDLFFITAFQGTQLFAGRSDGSFTEVPIFLPVNENNDSILTNGIRCSGNHYFQIYDVKSHFAPPSPNATNNSDQEKLWIIANATYTGNICKNLDSSFVRNQSTNPVVLSTEFTLKEKQALLSNYPLNFGIGYKFNNDDYPARTTVTVLPQGNDLSSLYMKIFDEEWLESDQPFTQPSISLFQTDYSRAGVWKLPLSQDNKVNTQIIYSLHHNENYADLDAAYNVVTNTAKNPTLWPTRIKLLDSINEISFLYQKEGSYSPLMFEFYSWRMLPKRWKLWNGKYYYANPIYNFDKSFGSKRDDYSINAFKRIHSPQFGDAPRTVLVYKSNQPIKGVSSKYYQFPILVPNYQSKINPLDPSSKEKESDKSQLKTEIKNKDDFEVLNYFGHISIQKIPDQTLNVNAEIIDTPQSLIVLFKKSLTSDDFSSPLPLDLSIKTPDVYDDGYNPFDDEENEEEDASTKKDDIVIPPIEFTNVVTKLNMIRISKTKDQKWVYDKIFTEKLEQQLKEKMTLITSAGINPDGKLIIFGVNSQREKKKFLIEVP